jgi:4-diphosphocytidyl-2-C-methyl-D-erythritol kinase
MLFFPNAKINLGLHILNRRNDGFHDIETLMIPIGLCDALEFVPSTKTSLTYSGHKMDIAPEKDLCIRAYQILSSGFSIPEISIRLHKVIPTGAGMGGGSSDAAYMLTSLNSYFGLQISSEKLVEYASAIGSDCPFFIENRTSIVSGKGEIIEPIDFSLKNFKLFIVHPGIHIDTAWAYKLSKPDSTRPSLKSIIQHQPPENWKEYIENDFEKIVFEKYPEIQRIKEELYSLGAIYASMTGSGSAVFGIFEKNISNLQDQFTYFTWQS